MRGPKHRKHLPGLTTLALAARLPLLALVRLLEVELAGAGPPGTICVPLLASWALWVPAEVRTNNLPGPRSGGENKKLQGK